MSVTKDAIHDELQRESFIKSLSIVDWLFAAILINGWL